MRSIPGSLCVVIIKSTEICVDQVSIVELLSYQISHSHMLWPTGVIQYMWVEKYSKQTVQYCSTSTKGKRFGSVQNVISQVIRYLISWSKIRRNAFKANIFSRRVRLMFRLGQRGEEEVSSFPSPLLLQQPPPLLLQLCGAE